jgi:hypothetical protein
LQSKGTLLTGSFYAHLLSGMIEGVQEVINIDDCVDRSPAPPPATTSSYRGVNVKEGQVSKSIH